MEHVYRRKLRIAESTLVLSAQETVNTPAIPANTFILRWNPDISSHTLKDFEQCLDCYCPDRFYYEWSIFDYNKAISGDRVFMVKTGSGTHGIVLAGYIEGFPCLDEDRVGQNGTTYYVRIRVEKLLHPDNTPDLLTTDQLAQAIPDFNWENGHSGEILSVSQAEKMEKLWEDFQSMPRKD